MTVFRTLAGGAQLVLVVSLACVLLWFMALGFIVLTFLVPEETQAAVMGIATLTFLALVLITLVVTGAKGLWRWIGAPEGAGPRAPAAQAPARQAEASAHRP